MKLPKETIVGSNDPTGRRERHGRWYDDACGAAFALELVGERWSLLIVRELMYDGRRFTDLRGGLPGISAKVLSERLERLEAEGILQRRQLPPPAPAQVYELTPWGYGAKPSLLALCRWAASAPGHDTSLPLAPAAFMLSLEALFDPASASPALVLAGTIAISGERFGVAIAERQVRTWRGEPEAADFVLAAAETRPLMAAVYGKMPPAQLADRGLTLSGDAAAAARFIDLFHLPDHTGAP